MKHRISLLVILGMILIGCTQFEFNWIVPETSLVGDPARGQRLFTLPIDQAPPCSSCHKVQAEEPGFRQGPSLVGIADRAGSRIANMDAMMYLTQSIVDPAEFVVSGFRSSMYPNYENVFSEQEIADLVAYLLQL
ncbi:MAG: cytochrome c [Anaerolineae bacterium]|jgi:cytochrome c2|nr:cytochrome c [Anaerolineae bacterium]